MLRTVDFVHKTDTGRQRRGNEDSSLARPPLFVVADGMGGAQAGEVASQIAVDVFENQLPESGSPEERLTGGVQEANRQIYQRSRAEHERAGMGTTLTAAYLDDAHVAIAHVGDSRAYLFRDGNLTRLTQDHSLVDELLRRGKLTEEQAAEHPQRSIITRALGPEPEVEVDRFTYSVRAGDIVLLCSDGLTSMISEQRIADVLRSNESLERAAEQLIDEANAAGGRDNITVVLFRLEEVGGDTQPDQPTMVGAPAPRTTTSTPGSGASTAAQQLAPRQTPGVDTKAETPATPARAGPRLARTQGRPTAEPKRKHRRYIKPLAALISVLIVLGLIGAGGYLASRQLYFLGTNEQGIVTVYRGFPYELPGGIHLYETYYTSGVPAADIPPDRRSSLLNHNLRSQSDATSLIRTIELGQLAR
jgi:serine/threonine protein phosphatase PrpC